VKTDYLQQEHLLLQLFAMPLVRAHSYIDDKVTFVFVSLLQSDFQDFATLCQSVHR
jgi:hypothetical protein